MQIFSTIDRFYHNFLSSERRTDGMTWVKLPS